MHLAQLVVQAQRREAWGEPTPDAASSVVCPRPYGRSAFTTPIPMRIGKAHRLTTCATGGQRGGCPCNVRTVNTHRLKTCATRGSEGLPVPREPALLTSAGMDAGAQAASSERSPGWAERTSGDGALAAPSRRGILMHADRRRLPTCATLERLLASGDRGRPAMLRRRAAGPPRSDRVAAGRAHGAWRRAGLQSPRRRLASAR